MNSFVQEVKKCYEKWKVESLEASLWYHIQRTLHINGLLQSGPNHAETSAVR